MMLSYYTGKCSHSTTEKILEQIEDQTLNHHELFEMFNLYLDGICETKFILGKAYKTSTILFSTDLDKYMDEYHIWFHDQLENGVIILLEKGYILKMTLDIIIENCINEEMELDGTLSHYSGTSDSDFV